MAIFFKYPVMNRSFFMAAVLLVFALAKAYSQRNSSDVIYSNASINVVDISIESTVELEIVTTEDAFIKIKSSQGGEYKNAVVLNSQIMNDTLQITDPLSPSFEYPQDKLSAHKIIDDHIILYLPEGLEVIVNARSCFFKGTGNYKSLFLNVESGNCILKAIHGNLRVISVYADILIEETKSFIKASSKYGQVTNNSSETPIYYKQQIETIHGDITIKD